MPAEPSKPNPPAPAPSKKGKSNPADRKPDTRAPNVIWAERAEATRVIMQRQFAKLNQLGNARNATPSPEQEAAFRNWLTTESDRVMETLFGALHQQEAKGPLLTAPGVTPGFKLKK